MLNYDSISLKDAIKYASLNGHCKIKIFLINLFYFIN
jgi:hypothetical protein